MAISNLVANDNKNIANDNRQNISKMFKGGASNDNFAKESDIISGSFVASAANSITQLNTQLAKLQESSKAIVKSINDSVNKIKTVDKDMSQRFKKLNAEITASRPDFSKFLYKAPPLPLAEIAPGSIQEGKLAGIVAPPDKDKPSIIPPIPPIPPLGGGGPGPRQTPKTPQSGPRPTSSGPETRTTPKGPAGTPEVKPQASVPSAGSRTGAPTPVETPPAAKPSGTPAKVGEGKELRKVTLARIGKILPFAGLGFTALDSYRGYKEAEDAYEAAIAANTPKEQALKEFYGAISGLVGEQIGSFLAGLGGASVGGMLGTAGGPIGTIVGSIGGGVIGATIGADLGRISGEALGDSLINGTDFMENFKARGSTRITQINEAAKAEEQRRLATPSGQDKMQATVSSIGGQAPLPQLTTEQKKQFQSLSREEKAKYGNSPIEWMKQTQQGPPAPPPTNIQTETEDGNTGTPNAPTGEATADKTAVGPGAPAPTAPAPSTPSAPPPPPRPNQGAGGADVVVNNTTNTTASSSGGEGQNVTNPNMKLNAHNPFIKDSLGRQMLQEHN
jgi:outer membrane lipoprotein SlyB